MRKGNVYFGILLIFFGALLAVNNLFGLRWFTIANFWPFIVLLLGFVFEWGYFATKRTPGLLVPGGILITLGFLFIFETMTNWQFTTYTWPIYPLSVALGLFQLYLYSGRNRGLLIPVFILCGISCIAFATMLFSSLLTWVNFSLIFSLLLILLGLIILFKK